MFIKMENNDPNLAHRMALKKVKLTFQQWDYKGTAIYTIGGNTSGADILYSIAEDLQDDPLGVLLDKASCQLDFPFADLGLDEEGEEWYRAVLKDDKGNTCEIEDEVSELYTMLTGMEIIEVTKEEG